MKKNKAICFLILLFSLESHALSMGWSESHSLDRLKGKTVTLKKDISLDESFDVGGTTFYTNSKSILVNGEPLNGEADGSAIKQNYCSVTAESSYPNLKTISKDLEATILSSEGEYGRSMLKRYSWVNVVIIGYEFNLEVTCYLYKSTESLKQVPFLNLVNQLINFE